MVQRVAIYARVSTEDQSYERQIAELTAYAERCGYQVVQVFKEKQSGTKNDRAQRKLCMQLARARQIDAILVSELTRWGRSTEDLLSTLQELAEWKVSLKALTGMEFDLSTPQGKLMVTLLAAISEFERGLIVERVRSGMEHAKLKGTKSGKPIGRPNFDRSERVMRLLEEGHSVRDVAKIMDISPTTVLKVKQQAS